MFAVIAATAFLSISQAQHAVRIDARYDHPTHVRVVNCHHRARNVVRCWLVEESVELGTEQKPFTVIDTLEGPAIVTLKHGIERIHRP